MSKSSADLAGIRTFPQLVKYLRDELDWPIDSEDFEDLTFDYTPQELGIDGKSAAKIQEIKRLRPLSLNQPWGVFFVKFEPKRLPVVALRRILSSVVLKKRASANHSERAVWDAEDLLFTSNYGEGDARQITFAHFSQGPEKHDLPTLKVLGWDNRDTPLHISDVAGTLSEHLVWPEDEADVDGWRESWRSAFILRHREVITTSKELAIRLAALARAIRDRIRTALGIETETGPLTKLMKAFQTALVHDLDADGFADMYAQTIAYGLLSARIADPTGGTAGDVSTHMPVTNPFLKELMETFLHVGGRRGKAGGPGIDFDELGVSEVVELLDDANIEAVVLDFGDKNPQEDPVIHFYELFLKEYDPREKLKRGVFYTPRPVVSYIVRSVDELLRAEFGLEDGLADTTTWGEMAKRHTDLNIPHGVDSGQPFVQVLDPATGTGTFLVEVIDLIHRRMMEKWQAQDQGEKEVETLWNDYVPKHLLPRLHGYELLMAPYAIAHLKIGLKLYETGYRFGSDERVRIYLTNALEPAHDFAGQFEFAIPALAHEAQAVGVVKRSHRFTVIVGNPPYSRFSRNQGPWITDQMESYKTTVRRTETQIQALSDDYVKFLRLGHLSLEDAGAGILVFITNDGFLDGPLFRDMRHSLLRFFEGISILDLHGDSRRRTSPPAGKSDENVFDIQQGVAISSFSRTKAPDFMAQVTHCELWGTRQERYAALTRGAPAADPSATLLTPDEPLYLFVPMLKELEEEYKTGWHLYDIFGTGNRALDNHESYGAGFVTSHDRFAITSSPQELADHVAAFLDLNNSEEELWERFQFCSTNQWDFRRARRELAGLEIQELARRCLYRPFDYRFTVFDRNICTIVRRRITSQFFFANVGLLATRRATRLPFNNAFVTREPAEFKVASHDRNTIVFPLRILPATQSGDGRLVGEDPRLNLNPAFTRALAAQLGLRSEQGNPLPEGLVPEDAFGFIYAILHSPAYRIRYGQFFQVDFPRLPLPGSLELFRALADLGGKLVALHLLESPILDRPITTYGGPENPEVGRVSWSDDTVWLDAAATKKGQPSTPRTIGFRGVPEDVWNFQIGGYQVCEKWLKDRKGRKLSKNDIAHYQKIVLALSETIGLMQEIDEVIEQWGGWPAAFASSSEE